MILILLSPHPLLLLPSTLTSSTIYSINLHEDRIAEEFSEITLFQERAGKRENRKEKRARDKLLVRDSSNATLNLQIFQKAG